MAANGHSSTPSFFPFSLLTLIALFAVFIREKWSRPNPKPKAWRLEIENALQWYRYHSYVLPWQDDQTSQIETIGTEVF